MKNNVFSFFRSRGGKGANEGDKTRTIERWDGEEVRQFESPTVQ